MITIAVDYDGTLVDHAIIHQGYPEGGKPVPHAIRYLKRFIELDARIILWTIRSHWMRGDDYLKVATDYLKQQNIALHGVNINPMQSAWTASPKIYYDILIDDRAFGCPLIKPEGFVNRCVDWSIVGPAIEKHLLDLKP